ncbi:TIGR03087 family PEP-CTERM/XrtA system glycosyltransferase [Congregibacter litoralis]|uniref:Sugar transferase, PEP-CTERM/EpsH1 system associated n=1 Tax=Congregibacter litoralis KT71 TaxID=314285 RepID=A4A538_9GAMM|nr:TIGR03087 family PEP-CTERM/XrtA system glycosyltransferase [Congregibacter litoralis]EAQ98909.1 sugar transferase, PEP-CTERM/EpsH1 system associated [Congregibacter litoralis KT71]
MSGVSKPRLLFLTHRIPYPPNKGDKIRSFHLLKYLSEYFSIYLGTFVDDKNDWQYCAAVRRYCADTFFVGRSPRLHKLLSLQGLFYGQPLSVTYYKSSAMQRWVNKTLENQAIEQALIFCSPMAQFVGGGTASDGPLKNTVIDFVDVDSEKWRQYADEQSGPLGWIYRREAVTLRATECELVRSSQRSFLVSRPEAELMRRRVPSNRQAIDYFENGVDTEFFSRPTHGLNPFSDDAMVLTFVGAMDYWPNVDAVTWFANTVFPALRRENPALEFWIVGSKPNNDVRALTAREGVYVTGRVEDVRPYLEFAHAAVAPLRVARGVQNKVLEYMAMECWVLASNEAMEGIECGELAGVFPCTGVDDYRDSLRQIESDSANAHRSQLRAHVCEQRAWAACIAPVRDALLGQAC